MVRLEKKPTYADLMAKYGPRDKKQALMHQAREENKLAHAAQAAGDTATAQVHFDKKTTILCRLLLDHGCTITSLPFQEEGMLIVRWKRSTLSGQHIPENGFIEFVRNHKDFSPDEKDRLVRKIERALKQQGIPQ